MADTPRMGPGATPSVTPAAAEAAPKVETAGEVKPPVMGTMSAEPPSKMIDGAALEELRKTLKAELREELQDEFYGPDPSREQAEGISSPFNDFQLKLAVYVKDGDPNDPIPGFHLRIINDDGDRIVRHQIAGYAFVERSEVALREDVIPLNKDEGNYISWYVGTNSHGGPMRAYLMKMPKEVYEARQKRAQRKNDLIDEAIRRGAIGNPGSHAYVPKDTPIIYEPQRAVMQPIRRPS